MLPLNGVKQSFHMSIIFAPDDIVQGHDAIGREGRQSPGSEETSSFSDSCADPGGRRKVAVRQFADSGCSDAGSSKVLPVLVTAVQILVVEEKSQYDSLPIVAAVMLVALK